MKPISKIYPISHLQPTNDVAPILTPQTGASQYATQQARPRLISRTPTFFVIGCETQGDRVYAVTLVGYENALVSISPSVRKRKREPTWRSETFALEHMPEVTPTSSAGDLSAFRAQREVNVAGYSARDG